MSGACRRRICDVQPVLQPSENLADERMTENCPEPQQPELPTVSTIIIGDDSYLVLPDRQLFSYEQSAPADMGQEECHTHHSLQPNPRDDADTVMDDSLTIIWGSQEDSDPRPALRRSNAEYFEEV